MYSDIFRVIWGIHIGLYMDMYRCPFVEVGCFGVCKALHSACSHMGPGIHRAKPKVVKLQQSRACQVSEFGLQSYSL